MSAADIVAVACKVDGLGSGPASEVESSSRIKKRVRLAYDIQKFDSNKKEREQRGGTKKKKGVEKAE